MAGIDFGNMNCRMTLFKDEALVTLSAVPSCVAYGHSSDRLMGEEARKQLYTNLPNSVINFKHLLGRRVKSTKMGFRRILGRKINDPVFETFSAFIPSETLKLPNGSTAFKIACSDENVMVEDVLAGLFTHLRSLLNKSIGNDTPVFVLSVPHFFEQQQRIAVLTAGEVAGIKFRLINDHAALAYNYGMYRDLVLPKPEEPSKLVAFINCGHSAVQACVVAFNADRAQVLGAESDLGIGGLHFDALIRDHFVAKFDEYQINMRTNAHAWHGLLDVCEQLKKDMTKNEQPNPLHIERILGGTNLGMEGGMRRAEFEVLAKPMFDKFDALLQRLIQTSRVRVEDIADVELVGGSSRVPRIKQIASEFFNKEPICLNQDNAIACGCALRSAMFYSAHPMQQYLVEDPYDIVIEPSKLPKRELPTFNERILTERMNRMDMRIDRIDARLLQTSRVTLENTRVLTDEVVPVIRRLDRYLARVDPQNQPPNPNQNNIANGGVDQANNENNDYRHHNGHN